MTYSVRLARFAVEDMIALDSWLAEEAGQHVADAYLERVFARMMTLRDFPTRGTPRESLGSNVRSLTFERRLIILYEITAKTVLILRVVSGQRDLAALSIA